MSRAPRAVGSSVLLGRTEQLGVAAHPLVQRVDDLAAIDRGHHRHRRIERNLLSERAAEILVARGSGQAQLPDEGSGGTG